MADTIHVNSKEEFEREVLKSDLPVMVDFYADWCGPCKLAAPVMDKLSSEFKGKAKIVKLDVDLPENREIVTSHQVMSIPTVMTVKEGKILERIPGFIGEPGYRKMLEKALA